MRKYLYVDNDTLKLLQTLKSERKKRKLNQRKLAHIIGVNQTLISRYESGQNFPKLDTFLKLAEFFNWDISNNINFLFSKYKKKLNTFRKLKRSHGFSLKELQALTATTQSVIVNFFAGSSSVRMFALISQIFDEEARLAEARQYPKYLRKKVLS